MNDTHSFLTRLQSNTLVQVQSVEFISLNAFDKHAHENCLEESSFACRPAHSPFFAAGRFRIRGTRMDDHIFGFIPADVVSADVFLVPPTPEEDDLWHV